MNANNAPSQGSENGNPSPTYDPASDVYRLSLESYDEVLVAAIVAVGEIAGIDPIEMRPVYYDNDPQLLDDLEDIQRLDDIDEPIVLRVANHSVILRPDGTLVIVPHE